MALTASAAAQQVEDTTHGWRSCDVKITLYSSVCCAVSPCVCLCVTDRRLGPIDCDPSPGSWTRSWTRLAEMSK